MSWVPWLAGWLWFAPSPLVCRVRVADMPLPQRRHHKLWVAERVFPVEALVDVPEGTDEVLLVGPRYTGHVVVPRTCSETVVLRAKPRPARLLFPSLPSKAVLSCNNCPGIDSDANYLPASLPPMFTRDLRTSVSLWIRAPGFHSVLFAVTVYPGKNVVRVAMKPRSSTP
ncbi:MAG: hypothetical protein KUG77_20385 [Nannocystaceae bacterium]|nr:hypothetical protein [Nannocystaceae bacterium]